MSTSISVAVSDRGSLSECLVGGHDPVKFSDMTLTEASELNLPSRMAIVGYWSTRPSNFFPDFMVVNEADLADTHAWLSSFLNAFTPVTQWCRIWTKSEFQSLQSPLGTPSSLRASTAWVGAILAECAARTPRSNMQDLSGIAALASATFAAARGLSVWGEFHRFSDIAARYDELSRQSRDGTQLSAKQLLPLWYTLAGDSWGEKQPPESGPLKSFRTIFSIESQHPTGAVSEIVDLLRDEFDLPEIGQCASGPQPQRVDALDRLANRLLSGPSSPAIEAILGFGASLVDPGAVALPDLLKRYSGSYPIASIWAGSFAGLWNPRRVLSDFGGLGRIVRKELARPSDLFGSPTSDISFGELSRWLGPSSNARFPVRGLVARTLNIELVPGSFAAFPVSRFERGSDNAPSDRQRKMDFEETKRPEPAGSISLLAVARQLEELTKRVSEIEKSKLDPPKKTTGKGAKRKTV